MLVLSRHVNDAVVLDDQLIVTVIRLTPSKAELTVSNACVESTYFAKMEIGESIDVGLGTRVTLVDVCVGCGSRKALLSIDAPAEVTSRRHEVLGGGLAPK